MRGPPYNATLLEHVQSRNAITAAPGIQVRHTQQQAHQGKATLFVECSVSMSVAVRGHGSFLNLPSSSAASSMSTPQRHSANLSNVKPVASGTFVAVSAGANSFVIVKLSIVVILCHLIRYKPSPTFVQQPAE